MIIITDEALRCTRCRDLSRDVIPSALYRYEVPRFTYVLYYCQLCRDVLINHYSYKPESFTIL